MKDNEDEIEIKIEYFDSCEEDPLREYDKEIKPKDNAVSNKCADEFKNQEENLDSQTIENDALSVNYNKNNQEEPEIENWHKQLDEFGKYVCRFCDLSYCTIQTLRHHVRVKHNYNYHAIKNTPINRRRKYKPKCHICKKTFENINDLQQHGHTHGLNQTQNSCLLCLATFTDHNELLNHMTNIHESLKKLHICTTCGYNTSKLSNFKKHLNIHTGKDKKKCASCAYTTNNQPNMIIHEQIHSNEKPYICKFEGCEYSGKSVSALQSHRLIHNKEKHLLYCDKCNYSTVYKINLTKHIDTHQRKKLGDKKRSDVIGLRIT